VGDVVQIYEDYKDHADFLTVYVREAHPTDEWQMKSNLKDDVCYAQPKTLQQRVIIANDFTKRFKFPLPFGIDDMSNAANDAYAAWPERIYIIEESGHIAYRGGIGPFNYKPEEARRALWNGKTRSAEVAARCNAHSNGASCIIIPRAECTCKMTRTAHISRREL
jgi:hypothetical protein